jgi:hypothetical protein
MARFKVVNMKPVLLEIKQSVRADLAEYSSDVAVKFTMNLVRPLVKSHYANAIKQVRLHLRGLGIPAGVTSGGIRTITYGKADGDVGRFQTKTWPALSESYRKAHRVDGKAAPTSYKFWRKTRLLSRTFDADTRREYGVSVTENKSTRNHHKNRINTTVIVAIEPLPFPFERAVSVPFLNRLGDAIPVKDLSQPIDRLGLGRARFAETQRPFLRRMSSALGKEMLSDIAKKLRKL